MRHFEAHESMLEQLVNCFLEAYLNNWKSWQLIKHCFVQIDAAVAGMARQLVPKAFNGNEYSEVRFLLP